MPNISYNNFMTLIIELSELLGCDISLENGQI